MRRTAMLLLVTAALVPGCTRAFYRRSADRETYATLAQHTNEAGWPIGNPSITPPPASRLYDPFNPDRPPMPPDDPTADFWMRRPGWMFGSPFYHCNGDAPFIEAPDWQAYLPLNADGKLELTPDRAVELGVLNSREYEFALQDVYLTTLALTLNRYEFDLHWFALSNTVFNQFGSSDTELNTLTQTYDIGFTRQLAAGGQLIVDFANSFVFTFSGIDHTTATGHLSATLIQPLLRNAGRRFRLETLTEAERQVVYTVRDFARFRKRFYVNLTTQTNGGYLALLFQLQNIRNLESNLKSNEQNLRLHEALFRAESVSTVQVDQAFANYQQARLQLLQARTGLETSLDTYKQALGLPPRLPVTLDDSLLKPFQLVDPALEQLQGEVDNFFAGYRERDQAPTLAELRAGFTGLQSYQKRAADLADASAGELREWEGRLGEIAGDEAQARRERETFRNLAQQMPELHAELAQLAKNLADDESLLNEARRAEGWKALQGRARQLIAQLGQLYVMQTQVRVYLIKLKPIPYTQEEAVDYARANRLDLMNFRGRVVDAWRQIAVTANQLRPGLDVTVNANLTNPPGSSNPVDFRASASSYTVGLLFNAPLDRVAQRNAYRTSQVQYERARMAFMALDDQITAQIRQDLRTLELERANFGIARQGLISAARQAEAAGDRLLLVANAADTTTTVDILNALNAILQFKSTLLSSWISYETARIQLLFDMEALQLDPRGLPADEHDDDTLPAPRPVPAEPRAPFEP